MRDAFCQYCAAMPTLLLRISQPQIHPHTHPSALQLLSGDRTKNMKYLFRHSEAAGILTVLQGQHYAGHLENAWNMTLKITHGIVHVNSEVRALRALRLFASRCSSASRLRQGVLIDALEQRLRHRCGTPQLAAAECPAKTWLRMQVWEQAKGSAARATGIAASCDHDFAFLPAAYHLIFFLTVGFKGGSFDHTEVKKLLVDMDRSIARLDAWGMKERVLFDCAPKRYLIALKDEWGKQAEASKGGGKGGGKAGKVGKGKGGKKQRTTVAEALPEEEEEALEPLPAGHLRVTDWRVFDQRFYGFYTWLEPPMGKDDLKCTLCERPCVRVHRCAASANLRAPFGISPLCCLRACRVRVPMLEAGTCAALQHVFVLVRHTGR